MDSWRFYYCGHIFELYTGTRLTFLLMSLCMATFSSGYQYYTPPIGSMLRDRPATLAGRLEKVKSGLRGEINGGMRMFTLQQNKFEEDTNTLSNAKLTELQSLTRFGDVDRVDSDEVLKPLQSNVNPMPLDFQTAAIKLTYDDARMSTSDTGTKYVVELALVTDFEFSQKPFENDPAKIIKFFIPLFYDINLRFQSLTKSDISFVITSITRIVEAKDQPFLEKNRNFLGEVDMDKAFDDFSIWIWGKTEELPKFDLAVLISRTKFIGGSPPGKAWTAGACKTRFGTVMIRSHATWAMVTPLAHELGHSLGAPHDQDVNIPGGCDSRGYIMDETNGTKQYFFSECSDRLISLYVRSDQAACLRRKDEPGHPATGSGFTSVFAPSVGEQCRAFYGSERALAGSHSCLSLKCSDDGTRSEHILPLDNTPCVGRNKLMRCFRGRCLGVGAQMINRGSGLCLVPSDYHSTGDIPKMVSCSVSTNLLNQIRFDEKQNIVRFYVVYSTEEGQENSDKCLQMQSHTEDGLEFHFCYGSRFDGMYWELKELSEGGYLIKETKSNRCLKQSGDTVVSSNQCDAGDKFSIWKFRFLYKPRNSPAEIVV